MDDRLTLHGRVVALVGAVLVALLVVLPADPAHAAATHVTYILSAHPDDEAQVWAHVESKSTDFKVFVYFTQGEASIWCQNDGFEPEYGEINPQAGVANPYAGGRYSAFCKDARQYGTINILNFLAANEDSTLPGALAAEGFEGPFSVSGIAKPSNTNPGGPSVADKAEWWRGTNGNGVVIFFDMGDSNLTVNEVRWGVSVIRQNKSTFTIPTSLPERLALGNYRVAPLAEYVNCEHYDHADHAAVHSALWNHDMFAAPQLGRTCRSDSDRNTTYSAAMTTGMHSDFFSISGNTRVGDYDRYYGWLYGNASNPALGYIDRSRTTGATSATESSTMPPNCGHVSLSSSVFECGSTYARVQHFWKTYS